MRGLWHVGVASAGAGIARAVLYLEVVWCARNEFGGQREVDTSFPEGSLDFVGCHHPPVSAARCSAPCSVVTGGAHVLKRMALQRLLDLRAQAVGQLGC